MARRARRRAAARAQESLDPAVLERMEGDDGEPAARRQQPLGGGQAAVELAELVVDRDAQRLEGAGRGIDAAGAGGTARRTSRGELAGAGERRLLAGGDDGAGDAAGEALLAVDRG